MKVGLGWEGITTGTERTAPNKSASDTTKLHTRAKLRGRVTGTIVTRRWINALAQPGNQALLKGSLGTG